MSFNNKTPSLNMGAIINSLLSAEHLVSVKEGSAVASLTGNKISIAVEGNDFSTSFSLNLAEEAKGKELILEGDENTVPDGSKATYQFKRADDSIVVELKEVTRIRGRKSAASKAGQKVLTPTIDKTRTGPRSGSTHYMTMQPSK